MNLDNGTNDWLRVVVLPYFVQRDEIIKVELLQPQLEYVNSAPAYPLGNLFLKTEVALREKRIAHCLNMTVNFVPL